MIEVLDFMKKHLSQGKSVAMVSLTQSDVHTPGRSGAIMAVNSKGETIGTVGGGTVEFELTKDAVHCLETGKGEEFHRNLKSDFGMVCGGEIKGFINVLNAGERLIIFGGGHVSQVVAQIAEIAGFLVAVVEDRPEFQDKFGCKVQYHVMNPLDAVKDLSISETDYCLIVTRGHEHDKDILHMLAPLKLAYLGMIGSKPKVKATYQAVVDDGVDKKDLEKVYSPVGLTIDSDDLGEIGVSIVAELVAVKNGREKITHRKENIIDKLK